MLIFKRRFRRYWGKPKIQDSGFGECKEHGDMPGNQDSNYSPIKQLSDIQTSIKHTSNDTKVDDNPEKCHITGGTNVSSEKKIEHDGGHIPSRIPRTGKKIYPQRRCVICSENGTPRDTRYFCKGCMESPTLCKRPCFVIYHNKYLCNP